MSSPAVFLDRDGTQLEEEPSSSCRGLAHCGEGGGRGLAELDVELRGHGVGRAGQAVALHQGPGRRPVAVAVEQRADDAESDGRGGYGSSLIFEEMGLRYLGPINGHDLPLVISTLEGQTHDIVPAVVGPVLEEFFLAPPSSNKSG